MVNTHFSRGASSITVTAALSVAILIAALGSYIGERMQHPAPLPPREPVEKQQYIPVSDADKNGVPDWQDELLRGRTATTSLSASSTSEDPVARIGGSVLNSLVDGYLSLKAYNEYTPTRGEELAETIARNLKAPAIFVPHTESELTIDAGASRERILRYRADMRAALLPMVDFQAEPEFALYARFVATGDAAWLDKLSETAVRYRDAEKNALAVSVPASAISVHLRTVNALSKYTETLERLVRFANDPIASMALLRTYNEDEREFLLAFDALADFYVAHVED